MKTYFFCILTGLIFSSCSNNSELSVLETRITAIEKENKTLKDSLNSINSDLIKPYQAYEKILLSELETSPDKIIADYELLIKTYPNSYWKHEAKKRIENVKDRRKYWSEKNGWQLPAKPKKEAPEIFAPQVISCPGC